jgi:hypothetical protein
MANANKNETLVPSTLELTEAQQSKEQAEADKAKADPADASEQFKNLVKNARGEAHETAK